METRYKFTIALTIACFATISIILSTKYRKHRKQKHSSISSCYLKTESKPQQSFKRVLADNSYSQFKHLKLHDPNEGESISTSHPYQSEINALLKSPQLQFHFCNNGKFDLKMGDSYVWIETETELTELVQVLSKEKVFAVDTEQHSLRSFLGFTALIQISTEIEDYLVDTIALHDVMGILRPVFANPEICKVFHGGDNDVLWLQRDFHIYVVNLFDTAKACDVLSKPQKSLAYLLDTYCGISTNKLLQYQNPKDNIASENSDCLDDKFHFVLEASRRSNLTCLQLFSKEIEASPGESAASSIISRHLNDQGSVSSIYLETKFQEIVYRLCTWRDLMARMHDESLRYVLSDHAVVALADKVPTAEMDIYNTISQANLHLESMNLNSSFQSPSSVVYSHLDDLNYIFQDEIGKPDDIFRLILQKHMGQNGTCPLSVYNYSLLSKSSLKLTNKVLSKENGFKNSRQVARKASRDLFVQKFSCKSAVYHNCRIYANDGRLLCYCDRRKLEWYIRRDLAKLVEENPPAIILLFEPKGRPEDEDNDFYIQSKKNICVGCGEGNHYLRYRIIPSCYRMHFPEHLKSHRSHDIVLLCVDCHEIAHSAAEKYKRKIAAEFGIPLFIRKVYDSSQSQDKSGLSSSDSNLEDAGVSPLELRTAAMALLRHGPRMPAKRREELTEIVKKYYGGREISEEDLEKALLLGMSPHEKRRHQKKRRLPFKHSSKTLLDENETNINNGSGPSSISESSLIIENIDEHLNGPSLCSDFGFYEETSESANRDMNQEKSEDFEITSLPVLESDVNSERVSTSNGTINSVHIHSEGNLTPKHNSKFSLLGHGPHGKQVVDHLLKEYGEDGIGQFCQRWRLVFVEAIHPRFLPGGWDVKHSGRRDFGEFSIYNPLKKVSIAAEEDEDQSIVKH
ncbi:hypothetical protein LguiB_029820 [Lonicera macranthoides]